MSSQLGLFDRPAPYVRVSETSRAAAASIEPVSGTLRAVVLAFVRGRGPQGATCDEVEIALGMKHQTASARIRELAQAKLIRQTSERRATSSGRSAAVWRTA